MKLTKKEAGTKRCPMSMGAHYTPCCADGCAAWKWIGPPVLQKRIALTVHEICATANSEMPHQPTHNNPIRSEVQWQQNATHAKSLIGHPNVVARLAPTEDWVAVGEIEFCDEERVAYLQLKRDVDTKLLGYCGMTRS